MISELFGLLADIDVGNINGKFNISLNKRRIKSISAFSSNSIFYFPVVVSDQCTLEEVTMMSRALEKQYASFVIACISLMPFHRIRSDDQASVESYLQQFHQNMGINTGSGFEKAIHVLDAMTESVIIDDDARNFFAHLWEESKKSNTNPVIHLRENYESLQKMFNEEALDDYTRILVDRANRINEEMSTWGFIGSTPPDDFIGALDEGFLFNRNKKPKPSKEDYDELYKETVELIELKEKSQRGGFADSYVNAPYLERRIRRLIDSSRNENEIKKVIALFDRFDKIRYNEIKRYDQNNKTAKEITAEHRNGLNAYADKRRKELNLSESVDQTTELKLTEGEKALNENIVDSVIVTTAAQLDDIKDDKIKTCPNLTSLRTLEQKLKTLKIKYTRALARYKREYEKAKNKKPIKFAGVSVTFIRSRIDGPKSYMKAYTTHVAIINKKLALIEKRKMELRGKSTKKLSETAEDAIWTEFDYYAIDHLNEMLEREYNTPDSEIFTINEAPIDVDVYHPSAPVGVDVYYNATFKDNPPEGHFHGPNGNVVAGRMDGKNNVELSMLGKNEKVFTDMEMKKANDMIPTFAKASIGFIVDNTESVVMRDILVGVKTYVHRAPTGELVNDLYTSIMSKRKFLKFVKFISGEEKSLSDLLFGIKQLRADALGGQKSGTKWKAAFQRRKRWQKMSIPYLMKEYTPNGTVIITMNEVDYIRDNYGIDIMTSGHVKMLMDENFLLGFVILDQSNEIAYVMYDGQNFQFQEYSYNQLEREQQTTDRMMRELYRSFGRA